MRDITHTWLVWHFAITRKMRITWLIYLWHDSSIYDMTHLFMTWLIYLWHDSSICDMTHLFVTWLIYLWHDSSICDMTHLLVTWQTYLWHDKPICDTTHFYVCVHDMTHQYFTCLIHMLQWLAQWASKDSKIMRGITHTWLVLQSLRKYAWHDSSICDMARFYVCVNISHDSSICGNDSCKSIHAIIFGIHSM